MDNNKEMVIEMNNLGNLSLPKDIVDKLPTLRSFLSLENAYLLDSNINNQLIQELNDIIKNDPKRISTPHGVHIDGNIMYGTNIRLLPGTVIEGPCIIGSDSVIGPHTYIRPGTIIGKSVKIGFGVESKLSVFFDRVNISHYSYIGNSLIGSDVNIGAGVIVSTRRLDDSFVTLRTPSGPFVTKQSKFGCIIEQNVKIAVNVSIMPGSWIGQSSIIFPKLIINGYIPPQLIYKNTINDILNIYNSI